MFDKSLDNLFLIQNALNYSEFEIDEIDNAEDLNNIQLLKNNLIVNLNSKFLYIEFKKLLFFF